MELDEQCLFGCALPTRFADRLCIETVDGVQHVYHRDAKPTEWVMAEGFDCVFYLSYPFINNLDCLWTLVKNDRGRRKFVSEEEFYSMWVCRGEHRLGHPVKTHSDFEVISRFLKIVGGERQFVATEFTIH